VGFPRTKIVGVWWSGAEEDVIPAGDAAKGYVQRRSTSPAANYPVVKESRSSCTPRGKGEMETLAVGSIYYNRGVGSASSPPRRSAPQEKYGKGRR